MKIAIAAFAALMLTLGTAAAIRADPLPAGCDKVRSEITCTTTETAGNAPEHSSAQRVTETTEVKASFESSHPVTETCDGPPGQCK